MTVEAWTLDRYRDTQVAESRIIMGTASMLTQLGVIPGHGRMTDAASLF